MLGYRESLEYGIGQAFLSVRTFWVGFCVDFVVACINGDDGFLFSGTFCILCTYICNFCGLKVLGFKQSILNLDICKFIWLHNIFFKVC